MLKLDDNLIEWLKWSALVMMTADHIDKYIFHEKYTVVFCAARAVMPLFAFVLAYNLLRPGALASGAYQRTMKRLALYGTLASPAYIASGLVQWHWFPLNIMFLLLASVAIAYNLEQGKRGLALFLFIIGGAITEFWYFGISVFLASRNYIKQPTETNLFFLTLATGSLYLVNGNFWSLSAIAIILCCVWASSKVIILKKIERHRNIFYAFYPAHLTLIVALSKLL